MNTLIDIVTKILVIDLAIVSTVAVIAIAKIIIDIFRDKW